MVLCGLSFLLALPAVAQQNDEGANSSQPGEVKNLRQSGMFDSARIHEMRAQRRAMIEQERAEVEQRREMIRNNIDHPALQAGIAERRKHLERLAQLDRIKHIGEQNSDQALIDRALAARDLELRRYFMWRAHQRATAGTMGASIPQADSVGE